PLAAAALVARLLPGLTLLAGLPALTPRLALLPARPLSTLALLPLLRAGLLAAVLPVLPFALLPVTVLRLVAQRFVEPLVESIPLLVEDLFQLLLDVLEDG